MENGNQQTEYQRSRQARQQFTHHCSDPIRELRNGKRNEHTSDARQSKVKQKDGH
jgi:hypothetical protein